MLFNSYSFLFLFLPAVYAMFLLLRRAVPQLTVPWLGLASTVFYALSGPRFLVLLLLSVLFNFAMGRWITAARGGGRPGAARLIAGIGIGVDLLVLAFWKYADFLIATTTGLLGGDAPLLYLTLPVGISFFTFTQIAFLADSARGRVEGFGLMDYLLFVTWFPHLVAGPIIHHREIMPQFRNLAADGEAAGLAATGLSVFAVGLCKKVLVADTLAPYADAAFAAAASGKPVDFFTSWGGVLAYTFQLYFDFSGYSDMAIGLSLLFGVRLPANFDSPYKATNVIEFWRRWHMTLSRFLRDYLYIPLGGGRRGAARLYLSLMTTMVLGGLWHGAAWTFAAWGAFHGLCLCVNHAWRRARPSLRPPAWPVWSGRLLVLLVASAGWVLFRSESFAAAGGMFTGMAGMAGMGRPDPWLFTYVAACLLVVWLAPNTQEIFARYDVALAPFKQIWKPDGWLRWRPGVRSALIVGIAFGSGILFMGAFSPFLYFRF